MKGDDQNVQEASTMGKFIELFLFGFNRTTKDTIRANADLRHHALNKYCKLVGS